MITRVAERPRIGRTAHRTARLGQLSAELATGGVERLLRRDARAAGHDDAEDVGYDAPGRQQQAHERDERRPARDLPTAAHVLGRGAAGEAALLGALVEHRE